MTKIDDDRLNDVVEAIKALPDDSRDALVSELEARLSTLSKSHMTEAQRNEVKRRLALPRRHVADEEVRAILRRYNPNL